MSLRVRLIDALEASIMKDGNGAYEPEIWRGRRQLEDAENNRSIDLEAAVDAILAELSKSVEGLADKLERAA